MNLEWMARAACAESDLDFYDYTNNSSAGVSGESVAWERLGPLVEVCNRCPVIADCARFAMRDGVAEQYGVWAGSTATQRMRVARTYDPIGNVLSSCKENVAESRRRSSQMKLEVA